MATGAAILSFFRPKADWNRQELAEFYRVESALLQAGLAVTTDRGLSDEGDPWFVFCREDNGEVIAHFARIDCQYVVVSSAYSGPAWGRSFQPLVAELMKCHPLILPPKTEKKQTLFLHPASLLVSLVATSFLTSSEKSLVDHHCSPGPTEHEAVRPW
jgi:hypothetical protein